MPDIPPEPHSSPAVSGVSCRGAVPPPSTGTPDNQGPPDATATVSATAPFVVQPAAGSGNGVPVVLTIDPSATPSQAGRTTPALASMSGAASANANDGNADQSPAYRPFVGAPEPATTRIASSSRSTDVGAVHCPAPGGPSDAAMQTPAAAATASAMVDARPSQPPAASGRRSPSRAEPARPAGPPPPPPEPRRPSVPPPAPPVATLDAAATAAIANEVAAAAARQAVQAVIDNVATPLSRKQDELAGAIRRPSA